MTLPQGFELAVTKTYVPRLIVNIEGRPKSGKSHFGFTAPAPLAYLNFDKTSEEDVMRKFAPNKTIYAKNYWPLDATQEACEMVWEMFWKDYHTLLASDVRTIHIDTGTELWNVLRMAKFGKLTQVMPHQYVAVNGLFRQLLNDAYMSHTNLIITHKKKKEYLNNDWTGKYEMAGFSEIPFIVQVNIELGRSTEPPYPFQCKILDCAQNPDVMGLVLTSDMCDFPTLAQMILPESKPEDWT